MKKKFIIENIIYGGYYSDNESYRGILYAKKFDSIDLAKNTIKTLKKGIYSIKVIYITI